MKNKDLVAYLWSDKKRIFGMPISFTKYALSGDRLFVETGIFNSKYEEIQVYKISDLTLKRNFFQKLFRVGSIFLRSSDKTASSLEIKNIADPFLTKELLNSTIEKAKKERRMRVNEVITDDIEMDSPWDEQ